MTRGRLYNIRWDTSNDEDEGDPPPSQESLGLPTEFFSEADNHDEAMDEASDKHDYCILSSEFENLT